MSKRLVAIFISVIMILGCVPQAFAEDTPDRLIYTQEFMDCVDEYVESIGAWLLDDGMNFTSTLPDGKVILYYKGLKVYYEKDNRVIFGLSDGFCTVTDEVIGDYVFTNPSYFGYSNKKNRSGFCVYENGEIYSIKEAVEMKIISVEELAEIIPFTFRENETTPPPTISPQPSTATMPTTKETEPTEVTPLPTVVITPTEMPQPEPTELPTEGQWATQPESTEITYAPDVETNQTEPTEEVVATESEIKETEVTEDPVVEQQIEIKTTAKKVKFSKVRKAEQIIKKAITVENYQGKLKYKKVAKGSSKHLKINKNSGKITVQKGTKKGIHKIKVRITAQGNARSKPLSKIVVVKIKVK